MCIYYLTWSVVLLKIKKHFLIQTMCQKEIKAEKIVYNNTYYIPRLLNCLGSCGLSHVLVPWGTVAPFLKLTNRAL